MTEPILAWAHEWPRPSWLLPPLGDDWAQDVEMHLADGSRLVGIIREAQLQGQTLTVTWTHQAEPLVIPWRQLTSVARLSALAARTTPGRGAQQNAWDTQVAHQLLPFHLKLSAAHGHADLSGHSMGSLSGSYGLFLYAEQADGLFRAEWIAGAALNFVQVGSRLWHAKGVESAAPPVLPPCVATPLDTEPLAALPKAAEPLAAVAALAALPQPVLPQPAPVSVYVSAAPALIITLAQLITAMEHRRSRAMQSVEETILDLGYLSADDLATHRANADVSDDWLGDLLLAEWLTAEQLHRVKSRLSGLPEVDLAQFERRAEAVALDSGDARRYRVVPLGAAGETFFVASATPTDQELEHLLVFLLNRRVQLVWASAPSIHERLQEPAEQSASAGSGVANVVQPLPFVAQGERLTSALAVVAPKLAAPATATGAGTHTVEINQLLDMAIADVDSGLPVEQNTELVAASNFVELVRRIIEDAQRLNVSDIHIETNPGQVATRIRFRRDGDLEPYLSLPSSLRAPLVSRIKVMARLDIAERRRPQDGKINFADFGGSKLELRIAVLPTHDGLEDVVMRLLASSKPIPLAKLGFQPREELKVSAMSARSYGLLLAAGPTGSGKTTTLHSLLKEVNTDQRKIWTAEDPIEITQEGLRQVQVNPKIGLSFAAAMRAFLRADPDIIMIGEIRDAETAKIAVEASLTGHLVLSTLHTNNAAESVVRLLDLEMDPMNFADSLVGIVAQRLVRALCSHCAQPQALTAEAFEALVMEYIDGTSLTAEEGSRRLMEAAGPASVPAEVVIRRAMGCSHCGGKGYKGRMGIYEVLENKPVLRGLIQRRARPTEIFEAAIELGMRSLRHDALEKVVQGKIDMSQARVAYG